MQVLLLKGLGILVLFIGLIHARVNNRKVIADKEKIDDSSVIDNYCEESRFSDSFPTIILFMAYMVGMFLILLLDKWLGFRTDILLFYLIIGLLMFICRLIYRYKR